MGKTSIYSLLFLVLLYSVSAATITGTIYDIELNEVDNAIVEVNTTPTQRVVSTNGTYSLDIPLGTYEITAKYRPDQVFLFITKEPLIVKEEGRYNLDLFVFPDLTEEDKFLNDTEENFEVIEEKEPKGVAYFTMIVVLVAALIALLKLIFAEKKQEKKKAGKKQKPMAEKEVVVEDEDLAHVMKIIKRNGGRATQKDIRKEMPLSEAKISLMIAELEEKGLVKKIKKGRGNIIILR